MATVEPSEYEHHVVIESDAVSSENANGGHDVSLDPVPVLGEAQDSAPGPFSEHSLVDIFKAEVKELSEIDHAFVTVKGYEKTGLMIKYRLPESGKELDMIARTVERNYRDAYERNLFTTIDTILTLCQGLYVQPAGKDKPVMLDPDERGFPIEFDDRLAELMGMDMSNGIPPSRNILRRLFASQDAMILGHGERLNRWLQNKKADLESELWQLQG